MVIAKRMVGWVCFCSFAAAVLFGGWRVYMHVAPFFRGAAIYEYYPWQATDTDHTWVAREVAQDGLDSRDTAVLREFVNQKIQYLRFSGWDALGGAFNARLVSTTRRYMVGAALLDARGVVVAAYPESLIARIPRLEGEPSESWMSSVRERFEPRQPYESVVSPWDIQPSPMSYYSYYMRHRFPHEVAVGLCDVRRVHGTIAVSTIGLWGEERKSAAAPGELIGRLAWVAKAETTFVFMPPRAIVRSCISVPTAEAIAILGLVVYWLTLPVWVGMDAGRRGMRPAAWKLLVLVTNWIGLLAYLVARLAPPHPCPNCGERVLAKYRRCPVCGVLLLSNCPVCRSKMKPGWQFCPVCNAVPFRSAEQTPATASMTATLRPIPSVPFRSAEQTPATEPMPVAVEPAEQPSLSVTVRDAESGVPVPNAAVSIRGPRSLQGVTNRAGVFEARRLDAGSYTVEACREGCEPACAEIEVAPDSSRAIALDLKALPGSISGKIIDRATGRPVAGAHVYLDSSRLDRSVLSDASGGYVIESVPAGPYGVRVDAEGCASQTKVAELSPGQGADLDFALDRAAELQE